MNPYDQIDELEEEEDDFGFEDDKDDMSMDEDDLDYIDEEDLVPFIDQENLLDENFRDGNVYNYSGNKPQ